ncbi:MAG: Molybdenum cofactor cytidylyltransferase [Bacteroidota bacterium]|jgi:molybdenum cofactor cytidylyltransferase
MIHGLLLAAGASQRLGEPKQLLEIQDKSLLEWAILALLQTCDEVTVLLGAETKTCKSIIKTLQKEYDNLHYQVCESFQEGMGSTLSEGLRKIGNRQHVLVHLVDMPYINGFHLKYLINHFQKNTSLALVSSYKGQSAPPVVIPQQLVSMFYDWKGDMGLGTFWKQHKDLVEKLELGVPYQDIDTQEDWEKIKKQF